jgi:hypothetical protein
MKVAIAGLFGPTANDVLATFRRARYCSQTVKILDARLRELRERRDKLASRHGSEIEHQKLKVAATEEELDKAKHTKEQFRRRYDRLRRTLDSFWQRLGIRIRRLFSKDAPSVKQLRERLDGLRRGLEKSEDQVDYMKRVWNKQMRALWRLTGPIDDLDFAAGYLQREKEAAEQEVAESNAAIDLAIRETVEDVSPTVLQRKLDGLRGELDCQVLTQNVLHLRTVLSRLDALSCQRSTKSPEADVNKTHNSISSAIGNGFSFPSSRGDGHVEVTGRGTTHVKKTRTRTETTNDSSGRPSTRTRTETYWDRVNITFSGSVGVGFDIQFRQWQKDQTAEALCHEADAWFRCGAERFRSSEQKATIDGLKAEAETLTQRIRTQLEGC